MGKPDHQAKVKELEEKALKEARPGERVVTNKSLVGHDSRRAPDVQIIGVDNKTRKAFEAERNPTGKRNRDREQEYNEKGTENETHGVGRGAGKAKSDRNDPESS